MQKNLIILAHPKIEESIGNKIISELTAKEQNVEVRHLDKLYPSFKIDIKAEQEALLTARNIIFQYPLYWYSTPAILKEWIDQVFQYGFAFGQESALNDKKIFISLTIGSDPDYYNDDVMEKILFPIKGLTEYCNLTYGGEVVSFNINNYTPEAAEKAKQISVEHVKKLLGLINS